MPFDMYVFMNNNFTSSKLQKNPVKTWLNSSFLGIIYGLIILLIVLIFINIRQLII
ncbi:hypothetical protein CHU_1148 [Cytophaga hutchinsonii ATCC 33406]|uniref:Uncharacterized protein n=1 Tax=Cytophaga hutchinsonii (strain ATCC 33406 / DSM 1761 / CIP 103989 / NBRC 15051 / NCIMB 9469 / D465) TaxID=269798 RepID=A0A6N4SQ32_CYTH3|nr:hypothetical protein CHU_1148 [Cytophaga hutchinsonii ATCC 33406]